MLARISAPDDVVAASEVPGMQLAIQEVRAALSVLPGRHGEGKLIIESSQTWESAVEREPAGPDRPAHGVTGGAYSVSDLCGRHTSAVKAQSCLAAVA